MWAALGRFQTLMSKEKSFNSTAGNAVADDSRTSRPPQESVDRPRLSGPLDISLIESFQLRKTGGHECTDSQQLSPRGKVLFPGHCPPFSPLTKPPSDQCLVFSLSLFFFKIFNIGSREENFTDSAHSYFTSHKFERPIFLCDVHPSGKHEVQ